MSSETVPMTGEVVEREWAAGRSEIARHRSRKPAAVEAGEAA
jgi:hypothetical protein